MNYESDSLKPRRAILVFARDLSKDLLHRRLSPRFSELLCLPKMPSGKRVSADIHLFTDARSVRCSYPDVSVHEQEGSCFAERLNRAIECLAQLGYQQAVVVGRDCPEQQPEDIEAAFSRLEQHRIVIGPDHRGGCYLIGFHLQDRSKLFNIRWQCNTDCHELLQIFGRPNAFLLLSKHDIDSLEDIRKLAGCDHPWGIRARVLLAARNSLKAFDENQPTIWKQQQHFQRQSWQLPPPSQA